MSNKVDDVLIDCAIQQWCATDTTANTGPRGRTEARRLCHAFLLQFGPAPFASVAEPTIFEWLRTVNDEPCWRSRSRRPNRALPPRIIRSLLQCGDYPRSHNITEYRPHRPCGVDLVEWRCEWMSSGRFNPNEDDQRLWNAYVAEWIATKGAQKSRCDRYRAWVAHIGHPVDDRCAPAAEPGVPIGFTDPRNACMDPYVRFFVAMRWSDGMDLFRTLYQYCDRIDDAPHAHTMRSYVRPFYRLCVALAGDNDGTSSLVACLDRTTRALCVTALQRITVDRGRCVKCVYQFTAGGPWAPLLRWAQWRPITRREASYRPQKRQRIRDRFADDEVFRMQKSALTDPFSHGMLTFLLRPGRGARRRAAVRVHTGCRSGAVCHLRVMDVMDAASLRPVGSVQEKGGAIRRFCIDPILGAALEGAVRCNRGSVYVFPANGAVHKRNKSQNDVWLRRLCDQSRVHGSHVHMHGIRRTVISKLLDSGNSLSAVSLWIGHSSPTMTYNTVSPHVWGCVDTVRWLLGTGFQCHSVRHVSPLAPKPNGGGRALPRICRSSSAIEHE